MGAFRRRVVFDSVELASRPARDEELQSMYRFALHASHCERCTDPYSRYLAGKSLCDRGHHHARHLTKLLYVEGGRVYSAADERGVEVEVPVCYDAAGRLLKAIDRGLRIRREKSSSTKPAKVVVQYEQPTTKATTVRPAEERKNKPRRPRVEIVDPPRGHREEQQVIYVNRDGTPYRSQLLLGEEDEEEEEELIYYASPTHQHLRIVP